MSRIVLGVSGGVAAYKAALLLRALTEAGHDVRVVPTPSALHFVGAATFEALSGHPVTTDVWSDVDEVAHVRIGQEADLVVIAPATADLLARAAAGTGERRLYEEAWSNAWSLINRPGAREDHARTLLELARASAKLKDWIRMEQAMRLHAAQPPRHADRRVTEQLAELAAFVRGPRTD